MLEAVNSVLQTAQFVRPQAEQTSAVDSFAGNPERAQRVSPQAPYVSPYIYIDLGHNKAVIQLRNGETGDVEGQFPSEASLEARARAASTSQTSAPSSQPETPQNSGESALAFVQSTEPAPQQQSAPAPSAAPTAQQQAAFAAAARAGNSNAGSVTLFA